MSAKGPAHVQVWVALEDLDRGLLRRLEDIPVVDRRVCNQANRGLTNPLPKDDILVHSCRLQLRLLLQVEDLQGPRLSSQGDDLSREVHNGAIGLDGPPHNVVAILEVDDNNFGRRGLVLLFSNADIRV